ncbi:MAG: 30S ribosomal protein S16 [Planctomycetota bacterium]
MAVRIRLKKLGRLHQPYYRICIMDSRTPRDGRAIEEVGTYDPLIRETDNRVTMKADRIDYWLSVGALPTEKVKVLIDKYKGKVPETRTDKRRPSAPPVAAAPAKGAKETESAPAESKAE